MDACNRVSPIVDGAFALQPPVFSQITKSTNLLPVFYTPDAQWGEFPTQKKKMMVEKERFRKFEKRNRYTPQLLGLANQVLSRFSSKS